MAEEQAAWGLSGGLAAFVLALVVFLLRNCQCTRYRLQCQSPDGACGLMVRDTEMVDQAAAATKELRDRLTSVTADLEKERATQEEMRTAHAQHIANLTRYFTETLQQQFSHQTLVVTQEIARLGRSGTVATPRIGGPPSPPRYLQTDSARQVRHRRLMSAAAPDVRRRHPTPPVHHHAPHISIDVDTSPRVDSPIVLWEPPTKVPRRVE